MRMLCADGKRRFTHTRHRDAARGEVYALDVSGTSGGAGADAFFTLDGAGGGVSARSR
jgi:hypothetical protein